MVTRMVHAVVAPFRCRDAINPDANGLSLTGTGCRVAGWHTGLLGNRWSCLARRRFGTVTLVPVEAPF